MLGVVPVVLEAQLLVVADRRRTDKVIIRGFVDFTGRPHIDYDLDVFVLSVVAAVIMLVRIVERRGKVVDKSLRLHWVGL